MLQIERLFCLQSCREIVSTASLRYITVQENNPSLMDNVLPQYQDSNTPGLTGWDTTMSIIDIFLQMDATFGKPDAQAILANDTHYRARLQPNETLKTLFLCLKECQEVQIFANNPYTDKQLIINAGLLLRQAYIFPDKKNQ